MYVPTSNIFQADTKKRRSVHRPGWRRRFLLNAVWFQQPKTVFLNEDLFFYNNNKEVSSQPGGLFFNMLALLHVPDKLRTCRKKRAEQDPCKKRRELQSCHLVGQRREY